MQIIPPSTTTTGVDVMGKIIQIIPPSTTTTVVDVMGKEIQIILPSTISTAVGVMGKDIQIIPLSTTITAVDEMGNLVASFVPCLVVDSSFVLSLGLVARLSLCFNKFQCVHEAYVNTFLRASNLPHKCSRIHVYTYRSYDCNLPISKPSLYTYCTSKSLTISTS